MDLLGKFTRNLFTSLSFLSYITGAFAFIFTGGTLILQYIFVIVDDKKLLVDSMGKEWLNESNMTALLCHANNLCSVKTSSLVLVTRNENLQLDASVTFCLRLTLDGNRRVLPESGTKCFDNIQLMVHFLLSRVIYWPYQDLIVGKDDGLDSFSCSKPTAKCQ